MWTVRDFQCCTCWRSGIFKSCKWCVGVRVIRRRKKKREEKKYKFHLSVSHSFVYTHHQHHHHLPFVVYWVQGREKEVGEQRSFLCAKFKNHSSVIKKLSTRDKEERQKRACQVTLFFVFVFLPLTYQSHETKTRKTEIKSRNSKKRSMGYTWWTRRTEPLGCYQQTSFVFMIRASLVGDKRIRRSGQKLNSWWKAKKVIGGWRDLLRTFDLFVDKETAYIEIL